MEEQFYILYPAIVAMLPIQTLRKFLLGCVIGAPVLRSVLTLIFPANAVACYVLMPSRMDALALGGLVAISVRWPLGSISFKLARTVALAGLAAVLALFVVALQANDTESLPFMRSIGYTIIDITCAAALLYVLYSPGSRLSAALRWRPLVYTGQIAYGLYLLHGPASWLARRALKVEAHSMASVPVTFIAAFLAASTSWNFFERPILALRDRIGRSIPSSRLVS